MELLIYFFFWGGGLRRRFGWMNQIPQSCRTLVLQWQNWSPSGLKAGATKPATFHDFVEGQVAHGVAELKSKGGGAEEGPMYKAAVQLQSLPNYNALCG